MAVAFLAGDAAADADHDAPCRSSLLQRFPAAELAEDLFLGLFADRAGVDQDHVGLGDVVGQFQAVRGREHVGHPRRVVLVHLAAVGLDVELALGRALDGGIGRGGPLGGLVSTVMALIREGGGQCAPAASARMSGVVLVVLTADDRQVHRNRRTCKWRSIEEYSTP